MENAGLANDRPNSRFGKTQHHVTSPVKNEKWYQRPSVRRKELPAKTLRDLPLRRDTKLSIAVYKSISNWRTHSDSRTWPEGVDRHQNRGVQIAKKFVPLSVITIAHGMDDSSLQTIYRSVISKLTYASSAWCMGFTSAAHRQRLDRGVYQT